MIRFGVAKLQPGLRPLESGRLLRTLRDQAQGSAIPPGIPDAVNATDGRDMDRSISKSSKFLNSADFLRFPSGSL